MRYKWNKTGNRRYNHLGQQLQKAVRNMTRGGKLTKWRYRDVSERFVKFLSDKFGIQNLKNIQDKHLKAWVEYRKAGGIADKTIKTELSAIRYLHAHIDNAKHQLAESTSFNKACGLGATPDGRADRAWTEREYRGMLDLTERLNRPDVARVMVIAKETGLRLNEAASLKKNEVAKALEGGLLEVKGKGGFVRHLTPPAEAMKVLEDEFRQTPPGEYVLFRPGERPDGPTTLPNFKKSIQGFISRHRSKVQDSDREGSARNLRDQETGEWKRGALSVHGLRHTYAREELEEKKVKGYSDQEARQEVSEQLGHHRSDVTKIYTAGN